MSSHSQAEAREHLSDLIDRALAGEDVVITRDGRAVVEIKAVDDRLAETRNAAHEWLAAIRAANPRAAEWTARIREDRDEGY